MQTRMSYVTRKEMEKVGKEKAGKDTEKDGKEMEKARAGTGKEEMAKESSGVEENIGVMCET